MVLIETIIFEAKSFHIRNVNERFVYDRSFTFTLHFVRVAGLPSHMSSEPLRTANLNLPTAQQSHPAPADLAASSQAAPPRHPPLQGSN